MTVYSIVRRIVQPIVREAIVSALTDAVSFLRDNSDIYIDPDTPITGTDANVTGVNSEGSLGLAFTSAGAGTDITRNASGFTFSEGMYLRWIDTGSTYDGALVLIDATLNGTPAITGSLVNLENDLTSRNILQLGPTVRGVGPNNALQTVAGLGTSGQRETFGFITDHRNRVLSSPAVQAVVEIDGAVSTSTGTGTPADIVLNQIIIGQDTPMTLHRLAVFMIDPGGSLPDTIFNLWSRVSSLATSSSVFEAGVFEEGVFE